MEALRKFALFKKRPTYCLSHRLLPKRVAKFVKQACCEIRYLELFNRLMEGGTVDRNIPKRGMSSSVKQKSRKEELQSDKETIYNLKAMLKEASVIIVRTQIIGEPWGFRTGPSIVPMTRIFFCVFIKFIIYTNQFQYVINLKKLGFFGSERALILFFCCSVDF